MYLCDKCGASITGVLCELPMEVLGGGYLKFCSETCRDEWQTRNDPEFIGFDPASGSDKSCEVYGFEKDGRVFVTDVKFGEETMERHGWVTPLPSGIRARCGGPGMCPVCQKEKAQLEARNKPVIDWAMVHSDLQKILLKHGIVKPDEPGPTITDRVVENLQFYVRMITK